MIEDIKAIRCAVVVDSSLPAGLAANAASVITMTLGRRVDGLVGPDVKDADGCAHAGFVLVPVPILTTSRDDLHAIHTRTAGHPDAVAVGFSALAQSCRTYHEYVGRMALIPTADLEFVAVGVVGPRRLVNKLTGSLPLLR